MKVLIIDPININHQHTMYNSTFINIVSHIENIDKLILLLDESQVKQKIIQKTITEIKLESKVIQFKNLDKKSYPIKMLNTIVKIIQTVKKQNPQKIFFLATDNIYIPIVLNILKLFTKKEIFVVLHNNLENSKNSLIKRKIWKYTLRKNIKGMILSTYLQEKAKELFNQEMIIFPHPTYNHFLKDFIVDNNKKYDYLLLGRHSHIFFKDGFAKEFENALSSINKKVTIAIRKDALTKEIDKFKMINFITYDFPLSDKEYWQILAQSKILIIPPSKEERLTASGVHLDAITMKTPVIAPFSGIFIENTGVLGRKLLYSKTNTLKDILLYQKSLDYEKLSLEQQKINFDLSVDKNIELIRKI